MLLNKKRAWRLRGSLFIYFCGVYCFFYRICLSKFKENRRFSKAIYRLSSYLDTIVNNKILNISHRNPYKIRFFAIFFTELMVENVKQKLLVLCYNNLIISDQRNSD